MKKMGATLLGLTLLLPLGPLACRNRDKSKVLVTVGGEKITEKQFNDIVTAMVGDEARAKEILANPAMQHQRVQLLHAIAGRKAVLFLGRKENLEKDPKVKVQAEQATQSALAEVYQNALRDRQPKDLKVTDEMIKACYDDIQAKQKDQPLPPLDMIKEQLRGYYPQWLFQRDLEAKVKMTYAEEWK